jgi:hypothetical protein
MGFHKIKAPSRFPELLTARPEGMSYEKYKAQRSAQNERLKRYRSKGVLVFMATRLVYSDTEKDMYGQPKLLGKKKGTSFKGNARNLHKEL